MEETQPISSAPRKPKNNWGALANIDDDEIFRRVADGELPTRIADELGVDNSALSFRYRGRSDWVQAREQGMEARLDRHQDEIQRAADVLSLARAREAFRATAWRAEREHPARWGAKQQIETGPNLSSVIEALARKRLGQLERAQTVAEDAQVIDSAALVQRDVT